MVFYQSMLIAFNWIFKWFLIIIQFQLLSRRFGFPPKYLNTNISQKLSIDYVYKYIGIKYFYF